MIIPTWENYTDKLLKDEAVAPYQSSIAVDSGFEEGSFQGVKLADGSVTSAKISSISWDKGYGGTLILGGANNVNGVLSVKDALAVEKVRLDNTGILINTGKLTIKDENESTIIDSKGLVSVTNFASNYVTGSGSQSTNSTTYVDLTGMSLNFTLSRNAKVLFFYTAQGNSARLDSEPNAQCQIRLLLDTTQVGATTSLPGREGSGGIDFSSGSIIAIQTVTAGSHTIKAQFRTTNATYSASVSLANNQLGYIVLGT